MDAIRIDLAWGETMTLRGEEISLLRKPIRTLASDGNVEELILDVENKVAIMKKKRSRGTRGLMPKSGIEDQKMRRLLKALGPGWTKGIINP